MNTAENETGLHARPRVIVVDDNLATCMILRAIFQREFEVLIAQSGDECIELACSVAPALILMDIEMPGMRGYDACRAVRKVTRAPVIFVSMHDELTAHLDALDAGGQDFVLKPFDAKALLARTKALVQQTDSRASDGMRAECAAAAETQYNLEPGVMLQFLQSALRSEDLYFLADTVLSALRGYGLRGVVQIRHDSLSVTVDDWNNDPSPLAVTICEQIRSMPSQDCGSHFIVNCRDVSILLLHLPDEPELRKRLCAQVQTLAEITQSIAEHIAAYLAMAYQTEDVNVRTTRAQIAVEQLRLHYREVQLRNRIELEKMLMELKSEVAVRWCDKAEELGKAVNGFIWNILALMDVSRDEAETKADKLLETLMPSCLEDLREY